MFFHKPKNYAIEVGQSIRTVEVLEDGMFSQKMMGDGFFYESEEKELKIMALVKGKVTMIFPTKHAIGIKANGLEMIIHYGLDTVEENGAGIECLVRVGQTLNPGDVILVINQEYYQKKGYQTPIIVVFPNLEDIKYEMKIVNEDVGKVEVYGIDE